MGIVLCGCAVCGIDEVTVLLPPPPHTHVHTHSFCPALVVMSQLLRLNQNLAVSYHSTTLEWCNVSAVLYVHVCVCLCVCACMTMT